MSRKFRVRRPDERRLFPPSPQDRLPEKHLVHFLLDVRQRIDTSRIVDDDDSDKGGQPPFHPRMMLVLLLYAYNVGVFSLRKIMNRCETDVAFRIIVGEDNMESLDANERIDNVFIAREFHRVSERLTIRGAFFPFDSPRGHIRARSARSRQNLMTCFGASGTLTFRDTEHNSNGD